MARNASDSLWPCLHLLTQFNLWASIPLRPIHIILVNMLTMVSTLSTRPPLWQDTLVTEHSEKCLPPAWWVHDVDILFFRRRKVHTCTATIVFKTNKVLNSIASPPKPPSSSFSWQSSTVCMVSCIYTSTKTFRVQLCVQLTSCSNGPENEVVCTWVVFTLLQRHLGNSYSV